MNNNSIQKNPRSTVGTITEIYDYLRVLFARVGTPYSPSTNTHGDKGAVLSRDEIPIDYHTYVQRYFEMVRQKGTE